MIGRKIHEYQSHPYLVEKFQRSSDHPSIKYIYAVLLLTHISYIFTNTSEYIFSLTTILKPSQNLLIVSYLSEFFDVPAGCTWVRSWTVGLCE